ncbi:MAG: DUF58 domain-containing protein [Phycisphaerales bacterium]|nr:DUF58 domain-containing protein [Phycisphaerales bacterium]
MVTPHASSSTAEADGRRPASLEDLLGADLMARLDRLDIISRKVFAGKMPGERRSRRRGQSVEFDDYRPYTPGDDLRHIDWNVLARLDRLFLKLFREDEDLALHLVLDVSPSMDLGEPNKLVFAHRVAMAMGYIGLVTHSRVAVSTFGRGTQAIQQLPPMRGRTGVQRLASFLLESLNSAEPTGPTDFHAAMRVLARSRAGKGVAVLLSDMLLREGFLPGLNFLSYGGLHAGGFEAYVLQVLSPQDLDPAAGRNPLAGDLRLIDAERNDGTEVTVSAALLRQYRRRLDAHIEGVARACRARSIRHMVVGSDAEVAGLVGGDLRRQGLLG